MTQTNSKINTTLKLQTTMKKFLKFFCALLIGALSAGFVSCGDDGDDLDNPSGSSLTEKLQGTWVFDVMKIQAMGKPSNWTVTNL